MQNSKGEIFYRGFSISVLTADDGYVYRIAGDWLLYSIQTDTPYKTEREAIDGAKMFVDEHLAAQEKP